VKTIYFAHPINAYNLPSCHVPIEAATISLISSVLPYYRVVNPNSPEHEAAYIKALKESSGNTRDHHNAMQYFFKVVLPGLDASIAMPFLDGKPGYGVAGESKKFILRGKPALYMEPIKNPTQTDIDMFIKNPQNGLFRIRPFTDSEVELIMRECTEDENGRPKEVPNAKWVLQHHETRLRTWITYNKEKRPYEEAHLVKMPIPPGFYPEEKK
jgi:hypothetical protein